MATRQQLTGAFQMYFDEMQRCRDLNLGWALLHLVVCMPDICAALAHGETSGARYEHWCATYLPAGPLNEDERYEIRCKLLHQGSTLPQPRDRNAIIRWDNVRFMPPGSGRHGEREGGTWLLDVGHLHDEMVTGMRAWFGAVEAGTAVGAADVSVNLPKLVTVEPRQTRDALTAQLGVPVWTTASQSTGSVFISATKRKP